MSWKCKAIENQTSKDVRCHPEQPTVSCGEVTRPMNPGLKDRRAPSRGLPSQTIAGSSGKTPKGGRRFFSFVCAYNSIWEDA